MTRIETALPHREENEPMKWTTLISAAVLSAGAVLASLPASAQDAADRLHNQEHRIRAGVRQGDLSPREARNLQRRHRRLARRFRNGNISRRQMNRKLNSQSDAIKHDRSR
jgi:predicted RNase H-like nuclease (RuvC/YqgF family)